MLNKYIRNIGWSIFTILAVSSLLGCFLDGGDGDGGVTITCGDSEAVYVRIDGVNTNTGEIDQPLQTIQAAVSCAVSGQEIRVANGTYETDMVVRGAILLEEGKSIYGGYSSDYLVRDTAIYPTIINDVTDTNNQQLGMAWAVKTSMSTTDATVFDGFTINAATGIDHVSLSITAIAVEGSPTISNNIINGGSSVHYGIPSGIRIIKGGAVIKDNTIDCGGWYQAYGIYVDEINALFVVSNNIISCTNVETRAVGIQIEQSSSEVLVISNNLITTEATMGSYGIVLPNNSNGGIIEANTIKPRIYSGSGSLGVWIRTGEGLTVVRNNTIESGISISSNADISNNYIGGGIRMVDGSSSIIRNNIIFSEGVNTSCIYEMDESSPSILNNNDLICPWLYSYASGVFITDIAEINSLPDTDASDNISISPNLDSEQDYRLTGSSPIEVTEGGLDLSSDFDTDKAGNTRTVPWSMGAYEYD